MFEKVKKNKYGFYEVENKPTEEELNEYYSKKYYQDPTGTYQKEYSKEDVEYMRNKIAQRFLILMKYLKVSTEVKNFLDIGCGEGWALSFFKSKNWEVTGLDYSDFGCQKQNPDCLKSLKTGDIYRNLQLLISEGKKFNVIWLDNVLEHVLDPLMLIQKCGLLLEDDGILIIDVPNDFSLIQQCLYDEGLVNKPYWVAIPDHLSYFNKEGLAFLCKDAGFVSEYFLTAYPVDFNLFNQNTNYVNDPIKGKACHKARVKIENILHSISPDKTNELYQILAEMGLGREIIGFFKKQNNY